MHFGAAANHHFINPLLEMPEVRMTGSSAGRASGRGAVGEAAPGGWGEGVVVFDNTTTTTATTTTTTTNNYYYYYYYIYISFGGAPSLWPLLPLIAPRLRA